MQGTCEEVHQCHFKAIDIGILRVRGLLDSFNFIAFWENDRWSARILSNKRGEFLSSTNWSSRIPRFVDEYEQIDFNVAWRATDNLAFTLEGINLTEEPIVFRGRSANQVQAYIETDTRLMLGARYNF